MILFKRWDFSYIVAEFFVGLVNFLALFSPTPLWIKGINASAVLLGWGFMVYMLIAGAKLQKELDEARRNESN